MISLLNNPSIDEIKYRFSKFMDGVRVVMLINRGVQNSNKGSRRWINKIITTNEDEWVNAVNSLMELQKFRNDPDVRLYSSINNRNLEKSIKMFSHKQIDLIEEQKIKFYSKINDSFCSCLMKPENRASKYFLLDIDTKDPEEVDKFVSDNMIYIIHTYPTLNGWHYIVDPFNVKLANSFKTFTVIKDGLLLVNYLNG